MLMTMLLSSSPGVAAAGRTVAIGYYRPSFPDDLSPLHEYEATTEQPTAIVHWYALWGGWKSAFAASDLMAVADRGQVPMITWEPWAGVAGDPAWSLRNAILSGARDGYIESWARGLAAYGRPVLLRFAHEMHDQPAYPWAVGTNGNTAEDYLAAWRRVRSIFARYPTANVKWVWNPNTLGDAPASAYASVYQALYPGDAQVDWVGLDIYNTGPGLDWGAPRWRSFSQVLAAPYAAVTAVSNRPVILAEVGSTEQGGSKADWITSALGQELANFPSVGALVWFDVDKEQAWQLHSSSSAFRAWQDAASPLVFSGARWTP
jgi:beta-mannanase